WSSSQPSPTTASRDFSCSSSSSWVHPASPASDFALLPSRQRDSTHTLRESDVGYDFGNMPKMSLPPSRASVARRSRASMHFPPTTSTAPNCPAVHGRRQRHLAFIGPSSTEDRVHSSPSPTSTDAATTNLTQNTNTSPMRLLSITDSSDEMRKRARDVLTGGLICR
ncbi:hypothetical protein CSAL01_08431, partial [Colletotrichum salicis]